MKKAFLMREEAVQSERRHLAGKSVKRERKRTFGVALESKLRLNQRSVGAFFASLERACGQDARAPTERKFLASNFFL